jgi:hypothetical protein
MTIIGNMIRWHRKRILRKVRLKLEHLRYLKKVSIISLESMRPYRADLVNHLIMRRYTEISSYDTEMKQLIEKYRKKGKLPPRPNKELFKV